jgi:hypothetical protein
MTHQYSGIVANLPVKTVDEHVFDSFEACQQFASTHEPYSRTDIRHRRWTVASNVDLRFIEGRGEDYFAIVLYNTEIVRYYQDGTFSVDNGGFNTPTTSTRVTQFTPSGYSAWHHKRKMMLNSSATGHEVRFPNQKETA